jgi:hypothetical protein
VRPCNSYTPPTAASLDPLFGGVAGEVLTARLKGESPPAASTIGQGSGT